MVFIWTLESVIVAFFMVCFIIYLFCFSMLILKVVIEEKIAKWKRGKR